MKAAWLNGDTRAGMKLNITKALLQGAQISTIDLLSLYMELSQNEVGEKNEAKQT